MSKQSNFELVMNNNLCLGCAACTQVNFHKKINMKLSNDGYLRPYLEKTLSETDEKIFARICPGLEIRHKKNNGHWHNLWGPIENTYVGWSTDSNIRHAASSGGGITAVLCYLLDNCLVDAVLHIGVSDDNPITNTYKISTSSDDVKKHCGSRYAPAAPLLGLSDACSKFSRIAIVGKPCDIVGARKLAAEDKRLAKIILYHISFMCAGLPSYRGTDAVIESLGVNKREVSSFSYRGNGWPGFATVKTNSGESLKMSYQDSWGGILNKHLQLRCKICIDGSGEFADITFADAWYGSHSGYPSFEEKDGRSLVIVRNKAGANLLSQAIAAGYVATKSLNTDDITLMQPYQATRKKLLFSRILAMKLFGIQHPRYSSMDMFKLSLTAGLKGNIISFLGMVKRIYNLRFNASKSK